MNQTRSKIGVMYGSDVTTAGGGNALPFYASCRLETRTQKKIEKKLTAKLKKIMGVNVMLKNVKNRTHRPFVQSEGIQLYFDHGMNPLSGLLSLLLDADRIVASGKGTFQVKEPWAGGDEVKFRASLDRNNMPMEILFKCPSLIDAMTEQEVKDYLEPFESAINFNLESDDIEQTDVLGEQDEEDIDNELG